MVKQRFWDFWQAGKSITEDIFFRPSSSHADIFVFDEVGFIGEACEGIYVAGDYNCRTGSISFNFYFEGIGAVRRFCLGGLAHRDAGRYHEHLLQKDSDAADQQSSSCDREAGHDWTCAGRCMAEGLRRS